MSRNKFNSKAVQTLLPRRNQKRLKKFFNYLLNEISGWQAYEVKPGPRWRQWRKRHSERLLRALELSRGSYLADHEYFPTREQVKGSIQFDESKLRALKFPDVQKRQAPLLWAASLVAPKIGGKNRYGYIETALAKKGIHWESDAIKMRVIRFTRDLRDQKTTLEGNLAILMYLFDGFKKKEFLAHQGSCKRLYPLRDDGKCRLTGLSDEEVEMLRELCPVKL